MCHDMGLPTVAEGIETRGAAGPAAQLGCSHGQGYLFGRPKPRPGTTRRPPLTWSAAVPEPRLHLPTSIHRPERTPSA